MVWRFSHGDPGFLDVTFGIGTSEVEHTLATQTMVQTKAKNMRVIVDGDLPLGDGKGHGAGHHWGHRHAGGTGSVVEFAGSNPVSFMEGRMTVCNMTIEGGARAGIVAPDETTFEYLKGRPNPQKAPPGSLRSRIGKRSRLMMGRRSIKK